MESFQAKGEETEKLRRRFKMLEQEWHAFKESKPIKKPFQKPHRYSPRELMFNLQQESSSPAEALKNVTRTMQVQEILRERREAIERGKFKGRQLFQLTVEGHDGSGVMSTPQREVRSMSFSNSEDESSGVSERVQDYYCTHRFSYSSSSSSSCLVGGDINDRDAEEVPHLVATIEEMRVASVGKRGNGRRMRYAVFLGGVAIILLVFAMCVSLAKSSYGDVILVPT